MYGIRIRGSHRNLCDEADNQLLFATFVMLSGGQILAIFYTLYGLFQIRPLDVRTNATKNKDIDIYRDLYYIICFLSSFLAPLAD